MFILLQGCKTLAERTNCEPQDMDCFTMVPIAQVVIGTLGDNVLDTVKDVHSAVDCKGACYCTENCKWFTFFNENDNLFPNFCFLKAEILTLKTQLCEEVYQDLMMKDASSCMKEICIIH